VASTAMDAAVPGTVLSLRGADSLILDVLDRELLCVVGPAGAGKTALVRALSGLDIPDAGSFAVNGRRLEWGTRTLGFTLAEETLFPWLSVRGNVGLPMKVGYRHHADPWRVDALLGMFGMLEIARRLPADLPPSTRRMVELCRALVRDPVLVVLDDPFRGLDFGERQVLAAELERMRAICGKTFLLFTQEAGLAVRIADRVAAMSARPPRLTHPEAVPMPHPRPADLSPEQASLARALIEFGAAPPRQSVAGAGQ
jgi:NitT/TauT family transport system ATP-binding protein